MAESILEQNVILEIAESVGTDDISTTIQTGTQVVRTFISCENDGSGDIAFNSPHNRMYYSGNNVLTMGSIGNYNFWYRTVGAMSPNAQMCHFPDVTTHDGLTLEPQASGGGGNKLVRMRLGNNGVKSDFSYGPRHSRFVGGGNMGWDADNSQDHDDNIQGRNLYMEDNTGSIKKTFIWEIFDRGVEKHDIILKGNGQDPTSYIHHSSLMEQLAAGGATPLYDWYISPWVHSGEWSSRDGQFTWDSENISNNNYMSYGGSSDGGLHFVNEVDSFINYSRGLLALRSDDFYYPYPIGDVNGVMDMWEVVIDVASMNNAFIDVIQGTPTDSSIPTGFNSNSPHKIRTAGVYKYCLSALQHGNQSLALNCPSSGPGASNEIAYNPLQNQANILRAYKDDSHLPAGVIINSIKITKKKPVFATVNVPVFQTGVAYSIDKYTWHYLDVKESEGVPLSLTYSVGDLKDIGKRTTGYSKTFIIPANKHNNEILSPMMAVGAERVKIHWMRARIKCNGINVFGGLMRVEEGNTGKGGFYKCHIIQDEIGWTQAIDDDTICDLALEGPGGISPPEDKSYNTIINSWDDTADTSDFFYGLVNYGEWQAQSVNASSTHDYSHNSADFHPAVFAKAITDKIFDSKGYSIESNFFNSDTFKKLCHPWVSGEDYTQGDLFESEGSQAAHVKLISKTEAGGNYFSGGRVKAGGDDRTWYPDLVPGVGNNWTTNSATGGYTAPFTGTYHGTMKATLYISQSWASNGSYMAMDLVKNGSSVTLTNGHTLGYDNIMRDPNALPSVLAYLSASRADSGIGGGLTKMIEFSIDLQAGDRLAMRMRGINLSNAWASYQDASDMEFDVFPVVSSITPDKIVNLSKVLPCMKQIDYLKGLTEMFNLQWTANEETKTVYCEPYNDFFGSGKVLDWSKKLDYESWNDKFIIEQLAKEVEFKYKEDTSDKIVDSVYRWKENNGYDIEQSHIELNDQKFRKDKMEMGTKEFSTTIMFNAYGTVSNPLTNSLGFRWGDLTWTDPSSNWNNPLMPIMWNGDDGHINTQQRPEFNMEEPNFDMRILNYYGKTNCAKYDFVDSSANINVTDEYPHLGHTNEWLKGTGQIDEYNISWADEDDGVGNISPGLFSKYWRIAYLKMNGGSALRTCKINLNANDISGFDYRDLILLNIDGVATYWTVNSIKDYKPNKNELTTVELIEWKQAKDFGKSRTKSRISQNSEPKKIQLISQSKEKGLVLRNDTSNKSVGTGIAFGNGVVANENQTVLGNYNKTNNTDILQVGSGIDSHNRTTALTIKGNGEVEIHGGECAVEETDGIIHDLVYTDTDGNIKKLYLKKE